MKFPAINDTNSKQSCHQFDIPICGWLMLLETDILLSWLFEAEINNGSKDYDEEFIRNHDEMLTA